MNFMMILDLTTRNKAQLTQWGCFVVMLTNYQLKIRRTSAFAVLNTVQSFKGHQAVFCWIFVNYEIIDYYFYLFKAKDVCHS